MNKTVLRLVLSAVAIVIVVFGFMNRAEKTAPEAGYAVTADAAASSKVVVYKTETCGCCGSWSEHLQKAGFDVEVINVENQELTAKKHEHGIEQRYWSCHTAVVDGYVVEGHVPADQVVRMLAEKPDIAGLSVPGMPLGSPGMEQGDPANYQDYDVMALDREGGAEVYQHIKAGN